MRYISTRGQAPVRDFAGVQGRITEADALIAYLQMLGTLVDPVTFHVLEECRAPFAQTAMLS